jgi:hypothetical protein
MGNSEVGDIEKIQLRIKIKQPNIAFLLEGYVLN